MQPPAWHCVCSVSHWAHLIARLIAGMVSPHVVSLWCVVHILLCTK